MVACWPLHPDSVACTARLHALLPVTAGLLRPGGCLVLIAHPATDAPGTAAPVAAAAAAGLGYLQHIVAVRATADGDTRSQGATGRAAVVRGDATALTAILPGALTGQVDIVLTSPPVRADRARPRPSRP